MGSRGNRNADPFTVRRDVLLGRPEPSEPEPVPQGGPPRPEGADRPGNVPQARQQPARGRWVSIREAAERLDTTQAALRMLVEAGELEARGPKKRLEVKLYSGAR